MADHSYEQVPTTYYVREGRRMKGTIKETPEGWKYSVKRSGKWSAPYEKLSSLQAAIEIDEVQGGGDNE